MMKNIKIGYYYIECNIDELPLKDKELVKTACEATQNSYAPYSQFYVGAAVRLKNGAIITGSNQENAAYPSGLCAERTAIFHAQHLYPDVGIDTLAIAGRNKDGLTSFIIPPCGACRQVMAEVENRSHTPLRIILYSTSRILIIENTSILLPFTFCSDHLKE